MMTKFFATRSHPIDMDVMLLVLRLVVGYAFIMIGYGKIQNPMAWMGPESPVPGFLQFLAAFSEFAGGIALVLGLLTRLASLGIAITMVVAVGFHAVLNGDPFISPTGGPTFAPALIYLLIASLFIVAGPGRLSLDRKIFGIRS